jgi:putative spermidine/putrescine transport system substrate-binding protein
MDKSYIHEIARRDLERITRRAFLARAGGTAVALSGGSALLNAAAGSAARAAVGGQLVFVGVDGEDASKIAKPFLTKNGVTLKVSYIADNDTLLTKLRTGGTHEFDVLTVPKDSAPEEIQLGFVQKLDLSRLTTFKGLFPGLQSAPWISGGGSHYGFPLIWGSEPVVYNPKKFTSLPPSYTDFADKKYAHSLTTIDEPYGNQWLVAKSLGYGENGNYNRLTQGQLNKVRDAWIELKKNVVSMTVAFGDQTDLLVRGEASIALNSWQAVVSFAKAKGVTLSYGTPARDGTYYWSDSYFIASQSPNPDTAYAYIEYMTSPQANAQVADSLQSGATIEKAVALLPSSSISKGYEYNLVRNAPLTGNIVKTILPPGTPEGTIVGKAAWIQSWEEVKVA